MFLPGAKGRARSVNFMYITLSMTITQSVSRGRYFEAVWLGWDSRDRLSMQLSKSEY